MVSFAFSLYAADISPRPSHIGHPVSLATVCTEHDLNLPLFLSRGDNVLSPFVLETAMHTICVRYAWRVA